MNQAEPVKSQNKLIETLKRKLIKNESKNSNAMS